MSEYPLPLTHDHAGQIVQQEIVAGLQSLILTQDIILSKMIGIGGYAEVYDGSLFDPNMNEWRRVAIKRFRVIQEEEKQFAKMFARELCIWARLQHENVLPLIGMVMVDGLPALASEWMANGTMNKYLENHEDDNILELAKGIASGLEYLHDVGVVHSDLKGDNVLISIEGRPVLSDFGISRLLICSKTFVGTRSIKGNTRWMAPELILADSVEDEEEEHSSHTKASDVWAFGMVLYEAMSGKIPFYTKRKEPQVISSILNNELPARPEGGRARGGHLKALWECCCDCWDRNPAKRPSIREVRMRLCVVFSAEHISSVSASFSWLSPTGRFLATRADDRKTISFVETRTMSRCGPDLKLHFNVYEVAWSNSEEYIVTRGDDGILRKWCIIFEPPILVTQSMQKLEYAPLEFSPDDRFIVCTSDKAAKLWDALNLSLIWECSGSFLSATFHPLGKRLVLGWASIVDVNIEDLENITSVEHSIHFPVFDVTFDPSGGACVAQTTHGAKILSGDTYEVETALPYRGCKAMRITPDGNYILLVLELDDVVLWDIAAGEAVEELALDLRSNTDFLVRISNNCRYLHFYNRGESHIVHLASTYY